MITGTSFGQAMMNAVFFPAGVSLTGCLLRIYTGSQPATTIAAPSGTLLAECPQVGSWTAATVASSVVKSTNVAVGGVCFQDTAANAAGTAGYWRLVNSGGTTILQGSVGTSGADLNLNSLSISVGQQVTITSFASSLLNIF